MSENTIVGIDLGTTNSAICVVESGFPILLADEQGRRVIPSAVYYAENGEIVVGDVALRMKSKEPQRVVTSVKRLMGRRFSELDEATRQSFSQNLLSDADGNVFLAISEQQHVRAVDVSAEILKHLKAIAEKRLGYAITKAVITVPAYFNEAQRLATKTAGELAGFKVERLLAEPTAAALSYGLNKKSNGAKIAVYDLGGGTFDVSILELNDGIFQVLSTAGDTQLGGDDFDRALLEKIIEHAQHLGISQTVIDLQHSRLYEEARRIKEELSDNEQAILRLPFFDHDQHLELTISRADFSQCIKMIADRTVSHCRRALTDANLLHPKEDVEAIVLVGGSTRIPAIQEIARTVFEREPNLSEHPDESIALGAGIQAGILSGAVSKIVLLDVTPLSLGIETFGGLMNVLIPRNTTIPCKAGEMFTNAVVNQESMQIRILQGERELAKDNWELGRFDVAFQPQAKSKARVGVQFSLDENGLLQVLARDTATGTDTVVEIQSKAIDVSDERVEKMINESVEHAFEDMDQRIFTEAKLKAEELLPAIDIALEQAGGLIDSVQIADIRQKADAVKYLLNEQNIKGTTLKSAVEQLDKATEHLAAIIVEQAIESMWSSD